jgi:Acyl-CoA reductase (LuxC)
MNPLVRTVDSAEEITAAADKLRELIGANETTPNELLNILESWGTALSQPGTSNIPGVPFLRIWLRRSTLEPIIARELGRGALEGSWIDNGRSQLQACPVGIVGHWPAGNVDIQPILSLTCALLGGNASIVRIPSGLRDQSEQLIEKLVEADQSRVLVDRIFMPVFDHSRRDLHEAMARAVDGAMIWGGEEAISQVRNLPFAHWAKVSIFGPRISLAALDAESWSDPSNQEYWCRRIAREVWQFDQQACSSPQVIFLEKSNRMHISEFVQTLKAAFESENRSHPRLSIDPALTSAICRARAAWLLEDSNNEAVFPSSPDWTILVGRGSNLPQPTQGKTLTLLEVEDLMEPIGRLDGNVQTLGLATGNPEKEKKLASVAAQKGVDRIVKLGLMHVFSSPWDGTDLIRPMTRMVRYVPGHALTIEGN